MSVTVGIDIGTNSLGWALIDSEQNEILDAGVRIFPMGVEEKSKESRNKARRDARQARRGFHRYTLRRKKLTEILKANQLFPNESEWTLTAKSLYGLRKKALTEQLSLSELGRVLLHLNSRRGFKSNRKTDVKADEKENKENDGILQQMNTFKILLQEKNMTVGEYFYSLFIANENSHNPDEPKERIRKRFIGRELYEQEFDRIWNKQQAFYPNLLTGNAEHQDKQSLYNQIKNECIFYQRPLKSQRHLVANCEFEPNKKAALKSSYEFQEFRLWQNLYNLKVTKKEKYNAPLTFEEIKMLAEYLSENDKISEKEAKKLLSLSRFDTFNEVFKQLKGNTTRSKLIKAIGKEKLEQLDEKQRELLLNWLNFYWDSDLLSKKLQEKFNLSVEEADALSSIKLEPDFGSLSIKAIRKILPHLKEGHDYTQACVLAGYHHSFDEETQGKDRILKETITQLEPNELRNPIVQRSVSEVVKVINAIIKQYGKPNAIHIEMARELKKSKKQRDEIMRKNSEKEESRKRLADFLNDKFNKTVYPTDSLVTKLELWIEMGCEKNDDEEFRKFAKKSKSSDQQKYRLWVECNRISPYSGKVISFAKLLSPEIEIEHIIPYRRSMDNSFFNKTLCEREINQAKGDKTPLEYFATRPKEELENFKKNIKVFDVSKINHFLAEDVKEEFDPNQLTNTGYIAKQVKNKIMEICHDVTISNGQATGKLRRFWGLNAILNPLDGNKKSRDDHRHHAVDALVIAATTKNYINLLSRDSSFGGDGKLINDKLTPPWEKFRQEAEDILNGIFISHRKDSKVVTHSTNLIHVGKGKDKKLIKRPSKAIRSQLHEETVYGQINMKGQKRFVVRKPIKDLKDTDLTDIVDERIRGIVQDHFDAYGKNAFELPIYSNEELKIPIKKVRIWKNENPYPLYPESENPKFVLLGNNHHVALYKDENGKMAENVVTFFHAVQRMKYKIPVVIKNPKEVWDFVLQQGIQDERFLKQLPEQQWTFQVSMKINDMFLFNINPEIMDIHDPNNKELVAKNLFRVWKLSKGNYWFTQQSVTQSDQSTEAKKMGKTIQCSKSSFTGIKIKIDMLGKLVVDKV